MLYFFFIFYIVSHLWRGPVFIGTDEEPGISECPCFASCAALCHLTHRRSKTCPTVSLEGLNFHVVE